MIKGGNKRVVEGKYHNIHTLLVNLGKWRGGKDKIHPLRFSYRWKLSIFSCLLIWEIEPYQIVKTLLFAMVKLG